MRKQKVQTTYFKDERNLCYVACQNKKNTNKISTVLGIFFCTPHLGIQVTPHQICWDILLQGIVFIKCCILMQKDEQHPVSRIVHSQLTPHQICCTAVVAKQKIQVFVLFDYFGEFIVPCRGKWLLKGVPKMLSKTT